MQTHLQSIYNNFKTVLALLFALLQKAGRNLYNSMTIGIMLSSAYLWRNACPSWKAIGAMINSNNRLRTVAMQFSAGSAVVSLFLFKWCADEKRMTGCSLLPEMHGSWRSRIR